MSYFSLNEEVYLRDRPMGLPLEIRGKIVGKLPGSRYAVLIENGINKGVIKKYDYWHLFSVDISEKML